MSTPPHPTTPPTPEAAVNTATNLSRARFLRRGAQGGLILAVGGAALAAAACGGDDDAATTATTSTAPAGAVDDVAIATLAATAELLAIDFYGQAIRQGGFSGPTLAYMRAAQQNEQDHYDALAEVLGAGAPSGLTFVYPEGTFASAASISATGAALKEAFVGAYMGAVTALSDNGLKKVAAQIGANEAQHLTTLQSLNAGALVPNPDLPKVLTAAEATAAVEPFLG